MSRSSKGLFPLLALALLLGGCASPQVLRPFTTDGCSLFPDGSAQACWADCCVEHDRAYWRGGTAAERQCSDAALRECVAARGHPTLADFMYRAVRMGGMPLWPTWYRWGYGWGYGRGYAPLTAEEQQQADEKLAAYRPSRPDQPSAGAGSPCVSSAGIWRAPSRGVVAGSARPR